MMCSNFWPLFLLNDMMKIFKPLGVYFSVGRSKYIHTSKNRFASLALDCSSWSLVSFESQSCAKTKRWDW